MFENNNKAIINKLAKESIKANRMRNIFAIIAIILTAVLLTSIFTIGGSMIKSFEYSTMRQVGTSAHGGFKNLTNQQLAILKDNKAIKEYGTRVAFGIASNSQLSKRQVEIQYLDENSARYGFITPLIEGEMPTKVNEIVLDTIVLDMLELSHQLGQRVTLQFSHNGEAFERDFVLSGYYQGEGVSMASLACVSKAFIEENSNIIGNGSSSMEGNTSLEVILNNSTAIEDKMIKIIEDSGLSVNEVRYGVNWAYFNRNLFSEVSNTVSFLGLLLMIILGGYLIIYNIFYISVVKDTRFYGLLKTIGTTSKQIRGLIIKQGLFLSLVGIPLGLIAGYLLGIKLTPLVTSTLSVSHTYISFNPFIFIGAALLSMITVFISCYKPASLAAAVSPIEAQRYSGLTPSKKNIKESTRGGRIPLMALSNLLRNKRKMIVVIASLAISIILFNSIYMMLIGFDMDKYLKGMAGADFSIGDESFYRWRFDDSVTNALTEDIVGELEKLSGVEEINRIFYTNSYVALSETTREKAKGLIANAKGNHKNLLKGIIDYNTYFLEVYGIDEGLIDQLQDYAVDGLDKIDLKGNGAIIRRNHYLGDLYEIGDNISITINNSTIDFEIIAILDKLPLYLYSGRTLVGGASLYISSDAFIDIVEKPQIMTALFNVNENYNKEIDNFLRARVRSIPTLDYRSKALYQEEFRQMIQTFTAIGYLLTLIMAFIGLLNFSNVMISSIITRSQEFATIQSIGMTTKQLRRILAFEGLYYSIFTLMATFVVGTPIAYYGMAAVTKEMPYFTYRFSIMPILVVLPALIIISILIPVFAFANINRRSLVERLRAVE